MNGGIEMKAYVQEKANAYKGINEIALKGEIVVFGSSYMANFPFYELINKCHLDSAVYNRSIDGMTSEEAEELLSPCVLDIAPKKIFLQLGESDGSRDDVLRHYRAIIRIVRAQLPDTKIYLIGLPSKSELASQMNDLLKSLCDDKKTRFIPFSYQRQDLKSQYISQFKQLAQYFRERPIDMMDAFAVSEL